MRIAPFHIAQLAAIAFLGACGDDNGGGATSTGPVTVATVEVTAPSTTLTALGATVQLQATAKDGSGNTVGGKPFTWASSDAQVASVSDAGLVTAVANGVATIRATTDGVTGSAELTVAQAVATVEVAPATALVFPGETVQFAASAQDAGGNAISGETFTWMSSNDGVATVSSAGLATAVASGSATITAALEGVQGSTSLTVEGIADHVRLVVSQGEPAFLFPKESGKESGTSIGSSFSNIARNTLGQVVSFDLTVTISASGNRYDIQVSNIVRNTVGSTTGYTASIVATIDVRTLSGTLTFP